MFLKRLGLLTHSFKALKSLLRFDSILSLDFFCFYCIIILIVILIRLKEFISLECCSIYLDALSLWLYISRKTDRTHWRTLLKYVTSLGIAIVCKSIFQSQTTSWNIFSRLLCNQYRLETVDDGLRMLKIVSCY